MRPRCSSSRATCTPQPRLRSQIASICPNCAATSPAGPSSSTISTASASGNPGLTAASAARIVVRSIISMAAGMMPAAMTSETAFPAASVESNAASRVRTDSGRRSSRRVTLVTTARVPSDPTSTPSRSRPGLSRAGPPSWIISPSGRTASTPATWWTVKPYFRQCAPPEFSATLPPIEQMTWLEGSGA